MVAAGQRPRQQPREPRGLAAHGRPEQQLEQGLLEHPARDPAIGVWPRRRPSQLELDRPGRPTASTSRTCSNTASSRPSRSPRPSPTTTSASLLGRRDARQGVDRRPGWYCPAMQRGRPHKQWKPASLVSSVEAGLSVAAAAARLGITGRTVARFAAAHPEFKAELDRARTVRDARYARGTGPAVASRTSADAQPDAQRE